jgi:hypothetical protein
MRRAIPAAMMFVVGLTVVLGAGLHAQVKKDEKSGLDRIEGTIQAMNKDASTITVRQSRTSNVVWKVVYNDKTKYSIRNEPAKLEDLKDGLRVIILGKFENETMTAVRIDIRTEK